MKDAAAFTRIIFEKGAMINNDEQVVHTAEEWSDESQTCWKKRFSVEGYTRVFTRPVYARELEDGLDATFSGSLSEEEAPPFTWALDDFYKLKHQVDFLVNHCEWTMNTALCHLIAYNYYDCLSGRVGNHWLAAMRMFVERFELDPETDVYGETIRDFLEGIANIPRFDVKLLEAVGPLIEK